MTCLFSHRLLIVIMNHRNKQHKERIKMHLYMTEKERGQAIKQQRFNDKMDYGFILIASAINGALLTAFLLQLTS